jgi:hypothetical protein
MNALSATTTSILTNYTTHVQYIHIVHTQANDVENWQRQDYIGRRGGRGGVTPYPISSMEKIPASSSSPSALQQSGTFPFCALYHARCLINDGPVRSCGIQRAGNTAGKGGVGGGRKEKSQNDRAVNRNRKYRSGLFFWSRLP